MDRIQQREADRDDVQKKDAPGKAGGTSAAAGPATVVQAKDGGGSAGAWNADAGLMSAFGIGGAPVQMKADAEIEPVQLLAHGDAGTPGKGSFVQLQTAGVGEPDHDTQDLHETAAQGVAGGGGPLPHLDQIQQAFGAHDVSGVQAHTGADANAAANKMGAEAYATGNDVAFNSGSPSLHTAAHEAAHVVQQRSGEVQLKGGVGQAGDSSPIAWSRARAPRICCRA